ncbi:MAG: pyridoxal-dependent decarboxylase, exosortase A system-associated [Pseudobacteriovorax sp.]|nr:pyridoxal-dependent decarboxylase, exosortase A system-associated [Pseudobacteriovorax sp.]
MTRLLESGLDLFEEDNQMNFKGINLKYHLDRFSNPSYVFYRDMIKNRMASLKENLDSAIKINYAIKSNPNPHVVELMSSLADGFDLASKLELNLALNTGIDPDNVSFAGPGKSREELRTAVSVGVTVNVESLRELDILRETGELLGIKPAVALRINVPFETKGFGLKMGGTPRQFGIDWEQVPGAVDKIKSFDFHFKGLHLFSGSQNLDTQAIVDAQKKSYELAIKFTDEHILPMKKINLGGGLGIPYYPNDKSLKTDIIKENLNNIADWSKKDFDHSQVALELGRYLVGEAGIYACEVIDIKKSGGIDFAITNGGLHHHLLATGNFGQVIKRNFPIRVLGKTSSPEPYRLTGLLCTPLDQFASKIMLPKLEPGDKIIIFQSGAYGKTSSPSGFLSHPEVNEILL